MILKYIFLKPHYLPFNPVNHIPKEVESISRNNPLSELVPRFELSRDPVHTYQAWEHLPVILP